MYEVETCSPSLIIIGDRIPASSIGYLLDRAGTPKKHKRATGGPASKATLLRAIGITDRDGFYPHSSQV
jgi:hypothetical protein